MMAVFKRIRSRLGRASITWIAGAAVTAAAGGLMLPYATNSDKDAQQTSVEADLFSPTLSPEPEASSVTSPRIVESPRIATSRTPSNSDSSEPAIDIYKSSPAGGSAMPPPSLSIPSQSEHSEAGNFASPQNSSQVETTADVTSAEESFEVSEPSVESNPKDRSKVELYYATDRAEILPWSFAFWYPVALPFSLAVLVFVFMLVAVVRFQQKMLWLAGAITCLIFCVMQGTKVSVRYHQAIKISEIGGKVFGGSRNDDAQDAFMHYGRALVTLPPNHQKGSVERPNALMFEYKESPDKHVMVRQIDDLQEDEFYSSVDKSVQQSLSPSVLLFIHGYNVGFEDALLRTAQLASDLEFDGVPMLFSWPSTGRLSGYLTDEENVEWSVTHLESLLANIKHRTQAERLHVIVHSMGNRALLGAVERLALRYPSEQPMLDQVVLAAPDVDIGQFDTRYRQAIDDVAKQVTLYTSEGDRALLASMTIHRNARLGLSTAEMRTYQGIDTVDVSKIDTSLLGHSYYGSQATLIKDIRALIQLGEPPVQRRWLQEVTGKAEPVLWRFADGLEASTVTK